MKKYWDNANKNDTLRKPGGSKQEADRRDSLIISSRIHFRHSPPWQSRNVVCKVPSLASENGVWNLGLELRENSWIAGTISKIFLRFKILFVCLLDLGRKITKNLYGLPFFEMFSLMCLDSETNLFQIFSSTSLPLINDHAYLVLCFFFLIRPLFL